MKLSQKREISYAIDERAEKRRENLILKNEGNLKQFGNSKYKTMLGYIRSKYGKSIY